MWKPENKKNHRASSDLSPRAALWPGSAFWGRSAIPGPLRGRPSAADSKDTLTRWAGSTWHLRSWKHRQNSCSINDLRQLSQPKASLFAHYLYKNSQGKLVCLNTNYRLFQYNCFCSDFYWTQEKKELLLHKANSSLPAAGTLIIIRNKITVEKLHTFRKKKNPDKENTRMYCLRNLYENLTESGNRIWPSYGYTRL